MQVDEKGLEAVAAFLKERDEALMPGEADDAERLESAQAAITAYLSARSAADIGALVAGITDENRHGEMWGARVPTSLQEATAMQIVAERWFAENGGPGARSAEPVAGLTPAEQKAQGARCSCRGVDDYCPCQNVPDAKTRAGREASTTE